MEQADDHPQAVIGTVRPVDLPGLKSRGGARGDRILLVIKAGGTSSLIS